MFRFTGDEKVFEYNPCAVYKLVSRISTFLRILKAKSDYFIAPEKLDTFRDDRAKLYSKYLNNTDFYCPYREFLREPICQILELVDENRIREDKLAEYNLSDYKIFETPESFMDFSCAIEFTFTAYLFRIFLADQDKIALLSLAESEVPVLTEQSHWVEKDKLTISEFTFVEPPAPILTDSEIFGKYDKLLHKLRKKFAINPLTFSADAKLPPTLKNPCELLSEDFQRSKIISTR